MNANQSGTLTEVRRCTVHGRRHVPRHTDNCIANHSLNPLTGTSKPHSNGPLYSNTAIGTLAVDGCAVTFGTAKRGLLLKLRGLCGAPSPRLLAVPNVAAHPSTTSVPSTVLLLYNGPLICGFNVPMKG